MGAALKRIDVRESMVLDDDSDAMRRRVGKRVIPILAEDDGLESMDMVRYIGAQGAPILKGPGRKEIAAWDDSFAGKTATLTWPRYPLLGLPEFATVAAFDHDMRRKRKAIGDFLELPANTRRYVKELIPELDADRLIEGPAAVNGSLSLDDIRVLPLLRSAAVVKGLRFTRRVRAYFEAMMSRIGFAPLPAYSASPTP